MIIADPMYGPIDVPDWLEPVLLAPEVQRLRGVRLINTTTPFLAALSDTRRYTHTVGVLHLALRVMPRLIAHDKQARDSLLAAAVLHDVGTPPFGHLFEYLLKSINGWNHEGMLRHIIAGDYRPEGTRHEIYFGNTLKLKQVLSDGGIDADVVADYVVGEGELGQLVAGKMDIDNIDNVYRMCHLLGLRPVIDDALVLADSIGVSGRDITLDSRALPQFAKWQKWRRTAYEVLAFDKSSLQGQAMLTEAISHALQRGMLSEENWFMTDEELLQFLYRKGRQSPELASTIRRFSVGDYYEQIFLGWYAQGRGPRDLRLPQNRELLRENLEEQLGIPCVPYVFYDHGTFEKAVGLVVQDGGKSAMRSFGQVSSSTVVGVYTPRRSISRARLAESTIEVLDQIGLPSSKLTHIPTKQGIYGLTGQAELPF